MYPDEAVVEVKTEERASEAGRGGDDLGHLLADDLLGVRACLAVEADLQLSHRCRASCENQQGQREQQRPDRHGP